MKFLITVLSLSLLASCGFKSEEESQESVTRSTEDIRANDTLKDSDGDKVTDLEEEKVGRNPNLADIPDIRVRFIQNYSLEAQFKNLTNGKEEKFTIDTKVGQDDPDFKYRVGRIFIRDNALKNAANIGKFSTHSWGEVEEHDLSWVKYPQLDKSFYSNQVLKYKKFFNKETYDYQTGSIKLENTVKLKGNGLFKSIKNLELNFYYYNYQKEAYELLATKVVERHFDAGVNELFEVEIGEIPLDLIEDNYFKKGEFIISEVSDFEIPELETTYKNLISSVKAKSIPVVYNTPLDTRLDYVGLNGKSASFQEILGVLFGTKFQIEENQLKKINQFENNLPEFTYLSEVRDQDKLGKWFVFTNRLIQHYLDHKFQRSDVITLSYVMGNELATQTNEKISSYRHNANSGSEYNVYPLGNITTNSKVDIQLRAGKVWGHKREFLNHYLSSPGGSCGKNCIRRKYECRFHINIFHDMNEAYSFSKDYSNDLERVFIVINQDEFALKDLIVQKKVKTKWIGNDLHISIDNIMGIKEINDIDENLISIKLQTLKETFHDGLKIVRISGRDGYTCPLLATNGAGHNKWPLNIQSVDFEKWQHNVKWDRIKRGNQRTISRSFDMAITSTVENHFN